MDAEAAREAFEHALASHRPGFETFFLARYYGLEFAYTESACIVEMTVRDDMRNPQGTLHGGVIGFVLDVSMGHLLNRQAGPGATLEMKVQYVRPVSGGRVRCEARFLRRGRSMSFLESRMTDARDRLVAAATATWRLLDDAPDRSDPR